MLFSSLVYHSSCLLICLKVCIIILGCYTLRNKSLNECGIVPSNGVCWHVNAEFMLNIQCATSSYNKATPSYIFVSHKNAGRFWAKFSEKKNKQNFDFYLQFVFFFMVSFFFTWLPGRFFEVKFTRNKDITWNGLILICNLLSICKI